MWELQQPSNEVIDENKNVEELNFLLEQNDNGDQSQQSETDK
jgi:hypothetical protein